MATIGGANSLKNGLVLHFDAANTKSFRGEPTTNLATNTLIKDGWPGSYTLVNENTKTFNLTTTTVPWSGGDSWCMFYYDVTPYIGSYITISTIFDIVDQTTGNFAWLMLGQPISGQTYLGYSSESDRFYKTTPTKEKISWSGIANNSGKIGITIWMNNGVNGSITVRVTNLHVEVKPYPTPFVNGTRGTTVATGGGFVDISNNNKHAELVNGPIYSSEKNGVLVMDGVNDRILYPNSIPNSTVCTVVMWVATTDLTFLWMSGNDCGYYLGASDTPASNYWHSNVGSPIYYIDTKLALNPGTSADGNFHMFEAKNVNLSTWTTFQFLDYCGGSSWNLNGKVGLIQIYNRNLTTEESIQNYNANKSRFI
jgi:hypothetical protein